MSTYGSGARSSWCRFYKNTNDPSTSHLLIPSPLDVRNSTYEFGGDINIQITVPWNKVNPSKQRNLGLSSLPSPSLLQPLLPHCRIDSPSYQWPQKRLQDTLSLPWTNWPRRHIASCPQPQAPAPFLSPQEAPQLWRHPSLPCPGCLQAPGRSWLRAAEAAASLLKNTNQLLLSL